MLSAQIEEICKEFGEIRSQAEGIVNHGQMPDAALHLNDVLLVTENATNVILDAVTVIGTLVDASEIQFESKEVISEQVGRIYEACSFQDISGQQIKKVLHHLTTLENRLLRLSETAQGHKTTPQVAQDAPDPLLNGPQLSSQAPTQSQVDDLFFSK